MARLQACLRTVRHAATSSRLARVPLRSFGAGATEHIDPSRPPTVDDVTVFVNFVDQSNELHRVPGRVGMSLREVAELHHIDALAGAASDSMHASIKRSDVWVEDEFGEGPPTPHSHVILPQKWYDLLPAPLEEETNKLYELVDAHVPLPDITSTSRLAEKVLLTKELNEIVVYLTEMPPMDIP